MSVSVLEGLRDLPLRDEIPAEALESLAPLGRIESHAKDAMLFHLGGPARNLRFVIHGRVALFLPDTGDRGHTIGTASKGDLLGWSALRGPSTTWTVSARATRETRCLVFPGQDVRALCDDDPRFGYHFMRYGFETVARRLTDARLQLLDVYGLRG